jgi:hypothetical protein
VRFLGLGAKLALGDRAKFLRKVPSHNGASRTKLGKVLVLARLAAVLGVVGYCALVKVAVDFVFSA